MFLSKQLWTQRRKMPKPHQSPSPGINPEPAPRGQPCFEYTVSPCLNLPGVGSRAPGLRPGFFRPGKASEVERLARRLHPEALGWGASVNRAARQRGAAKPAPGFEAQTPRSLRWGGEAETAKFNKISQEAKIPFCPHPNPPVENTASMKSRRLLFPQEVFLVLPYRRHRVRVVFNARKTWLERGARRDALLEPEWEVTAAPRRLFPAWGGV